MNHFDEIAKAKILTQQETRLREKIKGELADVASVSAIIHNSLINALIAADALTSEAVLTKMESIQTIIAQLHCGIETVMQKARQMRDLGKNPSG